MGGAGEDGATAGGDGGGREEEGRGETLGDNGGGREGGGEKRGTGSEEVVDGGGDWETTIGERGGGREGGGLKEREEEGAGEGWGDRGMDGGRGGRDGFWEDFSVGGGGLGLHGLAGGWEGSEGGGRGAEEVMDEGVRAPDGGHERLRRKEKVFLLRRS